MKTLVFLLCMAATLTLAGAACADLYGTNGSFETWVPDADPSAFWAVHPDTEFIGYHENITNFSGNGWVDSFYTLNYGLDYCTSNLWAASDGDRFIRFRQGLMPGTGMDNGFYNAPQTAVGQQYTLIFDMAGDLDSGPDVKSLYLELGWFSGRHDYYYPSWDGTGKVGVGTPHGSDPGWVTNYITFISDGGPTFITFANNTPGTGNGGALLDNVRLVEGAVVPEPCSLLALGAGLVGLIARRRR